MKNNIKIGDKAKIKNSSIANGSVYQSCKENNKFLKYFLLPLIVTVIGGVIVTIIALYLNK